MIQIFCGEPYCFRGINVPDLTNLQIHVPHGKFLREHVICFIWRTLQLFGFILEAARHRFLKNSNCCFLQQGTFSHQTNIFSETRLDLFIKYCLRVILCGFLLLWRHLLFIIKSSRTIPWFLKIVSLHMRYMVKIQT